MIRLPKSVLTPPLVFRFVEFGKAGQQDPFKISFAEVVQVFKQPDSEFPQDRAWQR
jgi:hypothetical protein